MTAECKRATGSRYYALLGACLCFSLVAAVFSTFAYSDQKAPGLPALFDALAHASEPVEAEQIERQIWDLWLEPPDSDAADLMADIGNAIAGADFAVAIEICDKLVQSHPNYAEAWNKRATLHYMLGNNAQSVADIRKTISLEPRHFGAISGLGLIFMKEGDNESALKAFEQVLSISPASMSAQSNVDRLRQELRQEKGREI